MWPKMNDSMLVAARSSDLKVSGDSVWAGLARDRRGQAGLAAFLMASEHAAALNHGMSSPPVSFSAAAHSGVTTRPQACAGGAEAMWSGS